MSKELETAASRHGANNGYEVELFKAGWTAALKSAPEVRALVEMLSDLLLEMQPDEYDDDRLRYQTCQITKRTIADAKATVASFRAAVWEK